MYVMRDFSKIVEVWFDGQFIFLLYPKFILQGYEIQPDWLAVRIHAEAM